MPPEKGFYTARELRDELEKLRITSRDARRTEVVGSDDSSYGVTGPVEEEDDEELVRKAREALSEAFSQGVHDTLAAQGGGNVRVYNPFDDEMTYYES